MKSKVHITSRALTELRTALEGENVDCDVQTLVELAGSALRHFIENYQHDDFFTKHQRHPFNVLSCGRFRAKWKLLHAENWKGEWLVGVPNELPLDNDHPHRDLHPRSIRGCTVAETGTNSETQKPPLLIPTPLGDAPALQQAMEGNAPDGPAQHQQRELPASIKRDRSDHPKDMKEKQFFTVGRALLAGLWGSIAFVIGSVVSMDNLSFMLIGLPVLGLPWMLFDLHDKSAAGEQQSAGWAVAMLFVGSLLTMIFMIPYAMVYALLVRVFG